MKSISIGVVVSGQPERLTAMLESLSQNRTFLTEVILLPDAPDAVLKLALQKLGHFTQLATDEPCGGPACFNRLASYSSADILVLLEAGTQPGPGWLEHMVAALDSNPANGLAGPSTNLAWNQQSAFPRSGGTPGQVTRTAREAARRFGSETRTLEPLHSLSDFCYMVRREVIAEIGAADEAYGTGPCWEMDYNIRAARAGWRGVWACAAYVHRAPFTTRRRLDETRRLEANKRLYQDRFCALKLRGEQAEYELHCKGDECEHFAPASLIRSRIPLALHTIVTAPATASCVQNPLPLVTGCN